MASSSWARGEAARPAIPAASSRRGEIQRRIPGPAMDRSAALWQACGVSLSWRQAQRLVCAAHDHAHGAGLRIAVAVVDEGGLLQALGRMDGAFPLSSQIAEAKAVGAALWHRDGGDLAQVQRERGAFFAAVGQLTRLPIIPGAGSVVMRDGETVLGAIGVSGATPEGDLECAEAGLRALFHGE
jgi:glc operon protein GlcG